MSKIFYIEPVGKSSPDLFTTMTPTFIEQWHEIVNDIDQAEVILYDGFSGLGEYDLDLIAKAIESKLPITVFDETDFGGMSKEIWDREVWDTLAANQKLVYFMRKMLKNVEYPSYVFPYEKVLMNEFPLTTSQELSSRPIEIFFCGNTSPQRESVCSELSKHFKCDFSLGQQKISHEDWLNRARQSKLFLTADGGGVSDERPYQLITISPMLRQKNQHLQVHPFKDYINCLEVSEHPTQEEIEGIKAVLGDPEYLFEIYESGIEYMREHYSAEARANYILEVLKEQNIL